MAAASKDRLGQPRLVAERIGDNEQAYLAVERYGRARGR
jgi:hypothetical protein